MNVASNPTVLACGAWLKNVACLSSNGKIEWSKMHGDLSGADACRELEKSVRSFVDKSKSSLKAIAHDLHPDFFSTQLAISIAHELGIPAIGVQHHHAHIAAVMAEYDINEPVIGLALDGVGFGTDSSAWGGELLFVSPKEWFRLGHLWPLSLPGGDIAAREPWRMAASAMYVLNRADEIGSRFESVVGKYDSYGLQMLLKRGFNCPETTSAGRLFDAAAGILEVSVRQSTEAEAAIKLEKLGQQWIDKNGMPANSSIESLSTRQQLDIRPLLETLLLKHTSSDDVEELAAWFHINLADALALWIREASKKQNVLNVCLGGGCFLNSILKNRITKVLESHGLRVYAPRTLTCGDAAIALGQAWVATRTLNAKNHGDLYLQQHIKIGNEICV